MNHNGRTPDQGQSDLTRTLRSDLPDKLTEAIAFLQRQAEKPGQLYFPQGEKNGEKIQEFIHSIYGNSRIVDETKNG